MERLKQLKALPWKIILPVAVLVITLALNIWLGCMPVFKIGAYVGNTKHWSIQINFNETTYSGIERVKISNYNRDEGYIKIYGFYYVDNKYIKFDGAQGSLYENEETNIIFSFGKEYNDVYDKHSVFSISTTKYIGQSAYSDRYEEINCINWCAVFLQIIYLFVYIFCLNSIIRRIIKEVSLKRKKLKDEQCKEFNGEKVQNKDILDIEES